VSDWRTQTRALGNWLGAHAGRWRPSPFDAGARQVIEQGFSARLAGILTGMDEDEVLALLAAADEGQALRRRLAPAMPELADVQAQLDRLLPGDAPEPIPVGGFPAHATRDIGARKLAQIEAFLGAVGTIGGPALDWCAGKGHLARLAALRDGIEVCCLERDSALCRSGEGLGGRDGAALRFVAVDALSPAADAELRDRHVLALHACGHLHRRLVADVGALGARALDLAPCCHDRGTDALLAGASAGDFAPGVVDRRLAVTGFVTASARDRRRTLGLLGWQCALRTIARRCWGSDSTELPWQRTGPARADCFAEWAAPEAVRQGRTLPAAAALAAFEADGRAEAVAILRASLPRLAFQRPLEVWLVGRLAARLEAQGFSVQLRRFCSASLTPRNLLVSARRVASDERLR
jgi:hypothetical protein